jgi:hypothetical protein
LAFSTDVSFTTPSTTSSPPGATANASLLDTYEAWDV